MATNNSSNIQNVTGYARAGDQAICQTAPGFVLSPTYTITGVIDGSTAAAGVVGEVKSSTVLYANKQSLTNNTRKTIITLSLPAGSWVIYGNLYIEGSGNVVTEFQAFISTSTAPVTNGRLDLIGSLVDMPNTCAMYCNPFKSTSSSAANVILSAKALFGSGTVTACGSITARRIF